MAKLFNAKLDTINRTRYFNPRINQGLAAFIRDLMGKFRSAFTHQLGAGFKNGDALMRW
jgi:hypothetical protein